MYLPAKDAAAERTRIDLPALDLAISGWQALSVLPHFDFATAALEMDLIHELADQVHAPAMVGIQVLFALGVGYKIRTESRTGVRHANQNPALWIRLKLAADFF